MLMSQLRPRSAALVFVVAAAGCGGAGPANDQAAKDGGTAEKAVALTEDEYQGMLDDSARAVSRAISDVRGASTRAGLQNRLEKSGAALDEAAVALSAR